MVYFDDHCTSCTKHACILALVTTIIGAPLLVKISRINTAYAISDTEQVLPLVPHAKSLQRLALNDVAGLVASTVSPERASITTTITITSSRATALSRTSPSTTHSVANVYTSGWSPGQPYEHTWWLPGVRSNDIVYIHKLFENNWTKRTQDTQHKLGLNDVRNFCTFAAHEDDVPSLQSENDLNDAVDDTGKSGISAHSASAQSASAKSGAVMDDRARRAVNLTPHSAAGLCPKTPGKLFVMASQVVGTKHAQDTDVTSIVKFAGYHWLSTDPETTRVQELSGPTHSLCPATSHSQWNGRPHSVLTELFVYHVDTVLQLYTASPGKIVFFSPADVIKYFHQYSCNIDEGEFANEIGKVPRAARMLGWAMLQLPNITTVGKVTNGELGCGYLCPQSIRARPDGYSDHVIAYAIEHIVDCDAGDEHECCPQHSDPTHGKTLLLRSVLRTCDRNNNCFAQKAAAHIDNESEKNAPLYRSLSLDNDCVIGENYYTQFHKSNKTYKPRSHTYTDKFHKCYLYPRSLREAYIRRMDEIRSEFPGYRSPILAAVKASIRNQMQHEHYDVSNMELLTNVLGSQLTKSDVSGPPPYLAWDEATTKTGPVSLLDEVAMQMHALFTSCNARQNSKISFSAYMDNLTARAHSGATGKASAASGKSVSSESVV